MGSTYSVALYGYDRVKMEAAADAALDEARRLDDLLSNYQAGKRVEPGEPAGARNKPVKVSPELVPVALGLRRIQPGERRGVRYHGRPADEGLGIL